ncbi:ferritin-like domain-containing protein [Nocardioides sp. T2.26MG-1]|uniref:ferritin-like domain-containing protein n=1 Tax=Nocardioides sp. T2.26MG-1 TaxID=3041166 RepID=UPI00247775A3|nr:ferritin-like domain-containing protein [Nocardioides sp. T2.26MG-1]CAI9419482.1 hypothetical protein HIDPHFAB_03714 [Nocardioides sp. T2.26MG-1]
MTEVDALQVALAAEHAAVYVYGAIGGRTSRSATPALATAVTAAYDAHRARRDQLTAAVLDLDAEPVAAEPAYELPRLDNPDQLARGALHVERACARTYVYLVASTTDERRRSAIGALNEAAVRELVFRGTPEIFPGRDEYADR